MVYLRGVPATEQSGGDPGKPSLQRRDELSKRQKNRDEQDGHSREKSPKR